MGNPGLPYLAVGQRAIAVVIQRHTEQLAHAGGEPGALEVDAQPAAKAHAALEVGVRLALPAKGGDDIADLRRGRAGRKPAHPPISGSPGRVKSSPASWAKYSRKREVARGCVAHAVPAGVVKIVARGGIPVYNRTPLFRLPKLVALAGEAQQVVVGIVIGQVVEAFSAAGVEIALSGRGDLDFFDGGRTALLDVLRAFLARLGCVIVGVFPFGFQVDLAGAGSVDLQRANQVGIRSAGFAPGGDRVPARPRRWGPTSGAVCRTLGSGSISSSTTPYLFFEP